jgi:integrase
MLAKLLTDRAIRALKPATSGRRDAHWDLAVRGFGVRVTDKGQARFMIMTRLGQSGSPVRRTIGRAWTVPLPRGLAPPLSLAEARDQARSALAGMKAGVDPKQSARKAVAEEKRRAESAFSAVAERFIAEHVVARKLKRGSEAASAIRSKLIPAWGDRPMNEITRADVAKLLSKVAREHPYAAHHLHGYVRKLLNWAIAREEFGVAVSPCDRISTKDLIGEKRPRDRVLSDLDLRMLWQATAPNASLGYPLAPFTRMLLLTGQTLREVAHASWAEIDLNVALWTIPSERMKGDAAHEVPLAPAVVDLLKALPRGKGPFVFSTTNGERPIAGFSKFKGRLDRALNGIDPWVFHDLRRTVRTRLGGLKVPSIVAELVIAHAQPGLHRAYDRHSYLNEKAEALVLWANKLLSIVE